MIRHFKPKKIIEVGAGFSTLLARQAINMNLKEGYNCELIAIDAFTTRFLKKIQGIKLVERQIQDAPLLEFANLKKDDMLFIDTTHVVKIGGCCILIS
jgi:uncharacterized UPF0146 family protein